MELKKIPKKPCPKCKQIEAVEHKLLTIDLVAPHFYERYGADKMAWARSPHTDEYFVSGLFCRVCEIAFIPDSIIGELGIEEIRSRGGWRQPRPYGVGRIISDSEYD